MELYNPSDRILLQVSHKGGSTVCIKMFLRQMGLLDEALMYAPWMHRYWKEVFTNNNPVPEDFASDPACFRFKIVRNPYMRAVSSYVQVMKRGFFIKRRDPPPNDWTFREFVEKLKGLNLKECDVHYRLQKTDLERKNPGLFHLICKLETLEQDIEQVNKRTGVYYDIEGLTSSHHWRYDSGRQFFAGDAPWSKLGTKAPLPSFFYDSELFETVTDLYREDFEAYGYEIGRIPESIALPGKSQGLPL